MTRTVTDLATVLDVIAGDDPESPDTALGVGQVPETDTITGRRRLRPHL